MLASRLLGYCLEHLLNHLMSCEDAMLTAVLLEHTLVLLSGKDAIFMGMLPEHALIHVESGNDAMFAGVLSMMRCSRACCWRTRSSTL